MEANTVSVSVPVLLIMMVMWMVESGAELESDAVLLDTGKPELVFAVPGGSFQRA